MVDVRDQIRATRASYGLRLIFLDSDLHRLAAGQNVLGGIALAAGPISSASQIPKEFSSHWM
jgi:hypothetical protein